MVKDEIAEGNSFEGVGEGVDASLDSNLLGAGIEVVIASEENEVEAEEEEEEEGGMVAAVNKGAAFTVEENEGVKLDEVGEGDEGRLKLVGFGEGVWGVWGSGTKCPR